MANAVVNGTVSRINQNGIGFAIEEAWEGRDGRSGRRFWSVWMPDDQPVTVTVGERVKVSGMLGTKVARDPRYVDHTINRATVERSGNAPVPSATESGDSRNTDPVDYGTPPEDPWANTHQWETTPIPEDTPF